MSSSSCVTSFAPAGDKLCYVQCDSCHTVLAVSVPCTSLLKTVTVRCGHCSNLLSVNMRAMLLPQQLDNRSTPSNMLLMNEPNEDFVPAGVDHIPKPTILANRPPEKRQKIPTAYNRFIKDEIQRIKARNPDISHREAFSAAAKNWAHFPHIHFGLMQPDHQTVKKQNVCQQEGDDAVNMKENGFLASPNVGLSPYY